jgi:hypothetical protein
MQRSAVKADALSIVPPIVQEVLQSAGQPLDAGSRAFMEPRFRRDFSAVRVHADTLAAQSTRAVNALAFTVGSHIAFGHGEYAPETTKGKWLLAHELTHVLQQADAARVQRMASIEHASGAALENEADAQATSIMSSQSPRAPIQGRVGVARLQLTTGPCPDIASPHRLLIQGSVHSAVREAQRKLNLFHAKELAAKRVGLADAPLVEDCVFGSHTFNAVLSFQRQQFAADRKEHDGKIGDHTWAAIDTAAAPSGVVPPAVTPPAVTPPTTPPAVTPPSACTTPTNPDMSGSSFNPTTDGENTNIAKHPIDAFRVDAARDDANSLAAASALPGPHLGPQDAFRHCAWNCIMAQHIGAVNAEKFATAHENSNPSSIPFDNQMDLHDNVIGRGLGAPGADPATVCAAAVAAGQLRTIRGPHTVPLAIPRLTTSCIGASNQPWP